MASRAQILYISSDNRQVGETSSRFHNYFPLGGLDGVRAVSVRKITFTNTMYSYSPQARYFYYYWNNDAAFSFITMPTDKRYLTADLLAEEMTTLFAANGHAIEAVFDPTRGKLHLTSATDFRPAAYSEYTSGPLANSVNRRMGFTGGAYAGAPAHMAESVLQLVPTVNLYVVSQMAVNATQNSDRRIQNVLIKVPVDEAFGSVIYHEIAAGHEITYPSPTNISSVDVQLFDDDGLPVDLNGGKFTMELRLFQ